jgi:hypothetical protein
VGVERAVTRWYLQRQSIFNEIAALETQLAAQQTQEKKQEQEPDDTDIVHQLAVAREKLRVLGPCPKPMMG